MTEIEREKKVRGKNTRQGMEKKAEVSLIVK